MGPATTLGDVAEHSASEPEHFDVLVVGAGLSGIGAGYHLTTYCPDRTYAILEGRGDLGGTWDLFRYPGIRSDSDMHTLGYSFEPWTDPKSIADGPSILKYVSNTASKYGIDEHIRYNSQVSEARWTSTDSRWTLTIDHPDTGDSTTMTCEYLFMCSGYYSYRGGHTPEFVGSGDFAGEIVHPQKWPDDLDYTEKNVVVIGSGATAVTLVPAMADDTKHITMLQRSPTYMVAAPDHDPIAIGLRKVLPERVAYDLTRRKNTARGEMIYKRTRTDPDKVKDHLLGLVREELGDQMVDEHFTPTYNPWDQRLCLVPNGDLFESIKSGKASVVTDTIERFTETGVALTSGEHLDADIIVTATGLELVTLGDMSFVVDEEPVDFAQTWTYKGLAYSDVPNLASSFGYINASWTLRADLTCEYVCRILNHMTETGTTEATPRLRKSDRDMPKRPWIDDFSSGYMQRMMPMLPKQGDRAPWLNTQRYSADKKLFRKGKIDDGVMIFS